MWKKFPILHPLNFQDTDRLTDSELLKYFYLSRNYFFFAFENIFMEMYLLMILIIYCEAQAKGKARIGH